MRRRNLAVRAEAGGQYRLPVFPFSPVLGAEMDSNDQHKQGSKVKK